MWSGYFTRGFVQGVLDFLYAKGNNRNNPLISFFNLLARSVTTALIDRPLRSFCTVLEYLGKSRGKQELNHANKASKTILIVKINKENISCSSAFCIR
jgi:hypothetical protein